MIKTITLLTLLVLSGCAATPTPKISNMNTSNEISQIELNESTGIVVGTYTKKADERVYDSQRLFFTDTIDYEPRYAIDKRRTTSLFLANDVTKFEINDNGKEGDVFGFVLPAGEYIFYNFSLGDSNGNTTETWSSEHHFAIPFEVHPNKVNYIGEFNFTGFSKDKTTIIGIKTHEKRGGYWTVSDQLTRDKKFIAKKFQKLSLDKIKTIIPITETKSTPFVVLPGEASEWGIAAEGDSPQNDGESVVGDAFSAWSLSCKKPYILEKNCSRWTGAKKKILVDNYKLKVAGSNDGKTILVMEKGASAGISGTKSYHFKDAATQDTPINSSYYSIKKIFDDNGIVIDKARPIKPYLGISGYILLLEKDGYTLLNQYSETKK